MEVLVVSRLSGPWSSFVWKPSKTHPSDRMNTIQVSYLREAIFQRKIFDKNVPNDWGLTCDVRENRMSLSLGNGSYDIKYV